MQNQDVELKSPSRTPLQGQTNPSLDLLIPAFLPPFLPRCQVNRHTVLILDIKTRKKKVSELGGSKRERRLVSRGEQRPLLRGAGRLQPRALASPLRDGGPAGRRPASHAALGDRGGPRTLVQRMFHTRKHPALQPEATRCLARGKPGPVPT